MVRLFGTLPNISIATITTTKLIIVQNSSYENYVYLNSLTEQSLESAKKPNLEEYTILIAKPQNNSRN